ncbi:MAG: hypothetical protein IPG45_28230 [Deltaproteobacteria bacterium]|nr:hypothetical protein [Deltaproteobacteria bacterium]
MIQGATKSGMKPILANSVQGFVSEPDPVLAEGALLANLKLIEGVVATYPDDVELLNMAAMARATYAFGFLLDELEAVIYARPNDRAAAQALIGRAKASYAASRRYAERSLADHDEWVRAVANRELEAMSKPDFTGALSTLEPEQAEALFWLAFSWGGSIQVQLDPSEATQLPKIEAAIARARELDPHLFYDIGVEMMAGVVAGFRSPALGGNPKLATEHFTKAKQQSGLLFPDVLLAQLVYAQNEQQNEFETTLRRVLASPGRPDRALLDVLAKRKACRLLANIDDLFLTAPQAAPEECQAITHKYPLESAP